MSDVETLTVVMVGQISGSRDGEPWPAPGESMELPADEARVLVDNGMAAFPDSN